MQHGITATFFLCIFSLGNIHSGFTEPNVMKSRQRQKRAPGDLVYALFFSAEQQQDIVNKHNSLRRTVNPTASNMRQMYWDDALAQLAKEHTGECTLEHSVEASTPEFATVGENIGKSGVVSPNSTIQQWFDEVTDYTYSTGECAAGEMCGHYTQVVWATSYKIGCAYALCNNLLGEAQQGYVAVCNYGPAGNQLLPDSQTILEKPYKSGTPCSECQAGLICVDQLCAITAAATPIATSIPGTTAAESLATTAEGIHTTGEAENTTTDGTTVSVTETQVTTAATTSLHCNGKTMKDFLLFLGLATTVVAILG